MEIKIANKCGFCFGVKRAIKLAEQNADAITLGPLIHNQKEIDRLKTNFSIVVNDDISTIKPDKKVIIRTHGIEKERLGKLKEISANVIDATCPYVTKSQEIVEQMSDEGYQVIVFGDIEHPEVKGVKSYANNASVVSDLNEMQQLAIRSKVALVSQTTKNVETFKQIAAHLIANAKEARIFNTICNATFDNQEAAQELAKEADVMIVIGGKNSANTKQLLAIAKEQCKDSYLVEETADLDMAWFDGKKLCGVTAGASTPDWIIDEIVGQISQHKR